MFDCTSRVAWTRRASRSQWDALHKNHWYGRCIDGRVAKPLESTMTSPNREESTLPEDPAEIPPTELNKPIGDAIPTPTEPGLDQPLPEKPKTDDEASAQPSDKPEPLGDDDPPPGVPDPGPSDFA
jgi:hypothetical protein